MTNKDLLNADPDGAAKRRAWREDLSVRFNVPPVTTAFWTEDDWIVFVDWTTEHNAAVLARYRISIDTMTNEELIAALKGQP